MNPTLGKKGIILSALRPQAVSAPYFFGVGFNLRVYQYLRRQQSPGVLRPNFLGSTFPRLVLLLTLCRRLFNTLGPQFFICKMQMIMPAYYRVVLRIKIANISIHIYVYVYLYTHTYISIYMCVYMYICVCI